MTRDEHLEHLVALMAPPFREAWKAYCWDKAKKLAAKDAEFADLPALLTQRITAPAMAASKESA